MENVIQMQSLHPGSNNVFGYTQKHFSCFQLEAKPVSCAA